MWFNLGNLRAADHEKFYISEYFKANLNGLAFCWLVLSNLFHFEVLKGNVL